MPRDDGLPPGTLILLILRVMAAQPLHGYAIAQRIHSEDLATTSGLKEVTMLARALNAHLAAATLLCVLAGPRPASAGECRPLCRTLDITGTRSLPWGHEWWARDTAFNLDRLVAEAEALLTPSTPVIVRMETIRRASIYASHDERVAEQLFSRLMERAARSESAGRPDAFALFDAAYMATMFAQISTFQGREVGILSARMKTLVSQADDYVLVTKSLALRPDDPQLHFGAALMASRRKEHHAASREHARRAREGAAGDPWLVRNLPHISFTAPSQGDQ